MSFVGGCYITFELFFYVNSYLLASHTQALLNWGKIIAKMEILVKWTAVDYVYSLISMAI